MRQSTIQKLPSETLEEFYARVIRWIDSAPGPKVLDLQREYEKDREEDETGTVR